MKWYKVKWSGFLIIDDNADMAESQLLESGHSKMFIRNIPSKENYEKSIVRVNSTILSGEKERERAEIPHEAVTNQDFFMSEMMLEKELMTDNMSVKQALKLHPKMAREAIILC